MQFRFLGVHVDVERREVYRDGVLVSLEPMVLNVETLNGQTAEQVVAAIATASAGALRRRL